MARPADTPSPVRSSLEELTSVRDTERPAGPLKKLLRALLDPVRRVIVGTVEARQHQIITLLRENDTRLTRAEQIADEHATSLRENDTRLTRVEQIAGEHATSLPEITSNMTRFKQIVEEHARLHEKLRPMHATISSHLESLENAKVSTTADIAGLRQVAEKALDHLSALQEDHTSIRNTVENLAANTEEYSVALRKIDELWADLHRDMTALAEAFSRLESD